MEKTLGSLFDGIGGFPLAGSYYGLTTLWASEIEPFPIQVTKIRFPSMKHLGNITKFSGADIKSVSVIAGGSPCQDLSVAGKRAGLAGQRSGLFMEQIKRVKEMRGADAKRGRAGKFIRPRFMVWENVPGAFSSNGVEDFKAVLEETCRIADDTVSIPRPPEGWPTVGAIVGAGFSVAWRVLDAQYWGVPQRRRRIFLVADFGGQSAAEILFKSESMSGYFTQGGATGQRTAADAEESTETSGEHCVIPINDKATRYSGGGATRHEDGSGNGLGIGKPGDPAPTLSCGDRHAVAVTLKIRSGCEGGGKGALWQEKKSATLSCNNDQTLFVSAAGFIGRAGAKAGNIGYSEELSPTLKAEQDTHVVCLQGSMIGRADKNGPQGDEINEDVSFTLNTTDRHAVCYDARGNGDGSTAATLTGVHQRRTSDYTSLAVLPFDTTQCTSPQNGNNPQYGDPCHPLAAAAHPPAICINKAAYNSGKNSSFNFSIDKNLSPTITSGQPPATCTYQKVTGTLSPGAHPGSYNGQDASNDMFVTEKGYAVRRLTPLECERLQGYPDRWTDIPGASDSARYKALGNSVAVPCVAYIMRGIAEELEKMGDMADA